MGVNFTDKEQNNIALMNVSYYDSIYEFMDSTGAGYSEDEALSDWEFMKEIGSIQEITRGTYNGATNDFDPWELSDNNILDTIYEEAHNSGFIDHMIINRDIILEDWNNADYVQEYTELFEVFIIGGSVYVNKD